MRRAVLLVCVLLAGSVGAQTLSDTAPPLFRLTHRNLLALRLNPLGLIFDGRLTGRLRLYESSSVVLRDNFVSAGLSLGATPAYARPGVIVEVQPVSFLNVWALYEVAAFFGTFDTVQSFPSASPDFSDTTLRALGKSPAGSVEKNYSTTGTFFSAGVNLNLKRGPFILRSMAKALRSDMKLRAGDVTWYDAATDVLMQNRQWVLYDDTDLLYQTSFGFIGGLRYSLIVPTYDAAQGAVNNSVHRLGPFLAFRFRDVDGAAFNQPTVVVVVNWHLAHRYRTGVDTSAALPYFALVFSMVGDLVPLK